MGIFRKDKEKTQEPENQTGTQNLTGENGQTEGNAEAKNVGNTGYQFAADVKLKECKYCRVMIPKSAKICPNCKMRLKKRWLRNLLILLVLAALVAGGVYWYVYEYQGQMIAVVTNQSAVSTTESEQILVEEADKQTDVSETTAQQAADTPEAAEQAADSAKQSEEAISLLQLPDASDNKADSSVEEESLAGFPSMTGISGKNTGKDAEGKEELEIVQPEVTEEDICGADGPILDYADKQIVIFHDYYGMFIYDRKAATMSAALDLEEIGCQNTQGDNACEVWADRNGEKVYLHPMNEDEMYVLAVEEQTLTKLPYTEEEPENIFEPEQTKECVENDPTVFRSVSCAELAKGTYLYLESGSGMAMDLCYVVEQNDKVKERVYLLRDYKNQEHDAADAKETDSAESANGKTALDMLTDGSGADDEDAEEMQMLAGNEESTPIDVTAYTESEFRELCQEVSYKSLLRQQDIYLNTAVTVELTVLKQVDGGLFDENIYYLCTAQENDVQRYYIVRDDRIDDDWLILEGDVLRIYGQLFGSCKVPAQLVASQPTVPALAMSYYELLEE